MSQVANNQLQLVKVSDLPFNVLNHLETQIKLQFKSLNMETRDAVVSIEYKGKNGSKWMTIVTSARLTVYAMNWLTQARRTKDADGNYTAETITNFQRFLDKTEEHGERLLQDIVFESLNGSPEYSENPFSIRFNKQHDVATIELVNMPYQIPVIRTNPMTREEEVVKYHYPRRKDNGYILKLPKEYYKRIIVK